VTIDLPDPLGSIISSTTSDDRRSLGVRASALNVFDQRYAYNFGNPFSGTHFGAPRTLSLAVRLGL